MTSRMLRSLRHRWYMWVNYQPHKLRWLVRRLVAIILFAVILTGIAVLAQMVWESG